MPGNEPEADDLEALANQETETTADPQGTQSDPVLDALKPSGHAQGQQKPPPPTDYQKRYEAMRPEFDKRSAKLKSLESIVNNPRMLELAKHDPTIAQAMAKAGYRLASEEARADGEDGRDSDDVDWSQGEAHALMMEAKIDLRFEMEDFASAELGRRFNAQESAEVRKIIAMAPKLSVEQAYSLTPTAKAARLSGEQKRIAEAQGRAPKGSRPRPTPNAIGGGAEKLDMKKHPSQFNEAEKREFLNNLPQ